MAASLLGPVVLATQSVLLVSASTTFQAPYSLSIAAAVRVGNLLGQSKGKRAAVASQAAFAIAFFIGVVWRCGSWPVMGFRTFTHFRFPVQYNVYGFQEPLGKTL